MLKTELKNIDPEDIEGLCVKIESSFDIKFVAGFYFRKLVMKTRILLF
jgi:hypothetical protein